MRLAASDVSQSSSPLDVARRKGAAPDGADALTQAQASALRRCAPLSTTEFKAQRQVIARQHRFSVMRILRHGADNSVVVPRPAQPRASGAMASTEQRRSSRLTRRD